MTRPVSKDVMETAEKIARELELAISGPMRTYEFPPLYAESIAQLIQNLVDAREEG